MFWSTWITQGSLSPRRRCSLVFVASEFQVGAPCFSRCGLEAGAVRAQSRRVMPLSVCRVCSVFTSPKWAFQTWFCFVSHDGSETSARQQFNIQRGLETSVPGSGLCPALLRSVVTALSREFRMQDMRGLHHYERPEAFGALRIKTE